MSTPPDRAGLPGWIKELAPTVIGAGVGYFSARQMQKMANAEAEKNRQFQADMSSTAHQREVRDLMLAGLNPMLSSHGSGASTPGGAQAQVRDAGEGISRGIASALAIKQARANIDLTESQAMKVRVEAADLQTQAASGRYSIIANQAERGELENNQMRALMPVLLAKAREELRLTAANVESVKARAFLERMAASGAFNEAEFQKYVGVMGPAGKALGAVMKALRK